MAVPGAWPDARSNPPAPARLLHRAQAQGTGAGDGWCQSEEEDDAEELAAGVLEDVDDESEDDDEEAPEVAGAADDELDRLSVR